MATERIAIRQDTASNWETANPTLASGEQGHESDTGRRKIGDGATAWNSLAYMYGTAATADIGTASGELPTVADIGTGKFDKSDASRVAWDKDDAFAVSAGVDLAIQVDDVLQIIASGTSVAMPASPVVGNDYAIWATPDGTLEATEDFEAAPTTGARRVGGFHYAPGGNATFAIDAGDGGTTPQINEFSFWDLKWRPAATDPRGATLVAGQLWAGMYHFNPNHLVGPVHKYGIEPCRDGGPPQNINGDGYYPDASPSNIFEALLYHGFRSPIYDEFQLLAYGVNEDRSIGGDDPGLTGDVSDRDKHQQTSHWGVFDATGVLRVWGSQALLSTEGETLPDPARGSMFRISRFASLGGSWGGAAASGSRYVHTHAASLSAATIGGRGVTNHLVIP